MKVAHGDPWIRLCVVEEDEMRSVKSWRTDDGDDDDEESQA